MSDSFIISAVILIIVAALGAAECFYGYRLFKIALAIGGFFAGMVIVAIVSDDSSLLLTLAGGVVGALICYYVYILGVFILGVFLGLLLGATVNIAFGADINNGIIGLVALACGVLAIFYQKFYIIVSTAFSGASGIVFGISSLLKGDDLAEIGLSLAFGTFSRDNQLQGLAILVLAILGIVYQYKTVPKDKVAAASTPNHELDSTQD